MPQLQRVECARMASCRRREMRAGMASVQSHFKATGSFFGIGLMTRAFILFADALLKMQRLRFWISVRIALRLPYWS
jgi:hypothetical protein